MNTLYFHCGIYHSDIEILGSLTHTGAEMSQIGRSLRTPVGADRHVFSNDDNVFNGMRVAIAEGLIDVENLNVYFHHVVDGKQQITSVEFNKQAMTRYWPVGFFDQCETDLMALLNLESTL